ncbi:MAG: nitrous oxide-stimulated promoter family protein [Syntrophales bacterium]
MENNLEREINTIRIMVEMFCKRHHGSELCEGCQNLSDYAQDRIRKCKFGVNKPVCADCTIHCFKQDMRSQIGEVMRFAGPRMTFKHPVLAAHHLLRKYR